MQLPSPRENNRENIPAAPTGMTLRRDVPEVQQADEYVSRVSTWLKQAIDTREQRQSRATGALYTPGYYA